MAGEQTKGAVQHVWADAGWVRSAVAYWLRVVAAGSSTPRNSRRFTLRSEDFVLGKCRAWGWRCPLATAAIAFSKSKVREFSQYQS